MALLTYFVVGPLFEDLFHVIKERQGSGRLSLVVSAASVVALVLAGVNTYRVLRGGADKALRIEFSEGVLRFFLGIAALAIGMIIGRTIFT